MKPKEIQTVSFSDWKQVKIIKDHAKKLQFNGKSHVWKDRKLRSENLERNQLTGQAGEAAGCTVTYGFDKYIEKTKQVVPKGCGDDGNDIVGSYLPIDIKTTCVEVPDDRLMWVYHTKDILVTPEEFSPNAIYIACMMNTAPTYMDKSFTVHVMGWTWGREMNWYGERENRNKNRVPGFRRYFKDLNTMSSMIWQQFINVA